MAKNNIDWYLNKKSSDSEQHYINLKYGNANIGKALALFMQEKGHSTFEFGYDKNNNKMILKPSKKGTVTIKFGKTVNGFYIDRHLKNWIGERNFLLKRCPVSYDKETEIYVIEKGSK